MLLVATEDGYLLDSEVGEADSVCPLGRPLSGDYALSEPYVRSSTRKQKRSTSTPTELDTAEAAIQEAGERLCAFLPGTSTMAIASTTGEKRKAQDPNDDTPPEAHTFTDPDHMDFDGLGKLAGIAIHIEQPPPLHLEEADVDESHAWDFTDVYGRPVVNDAKHPLAMRISANGLVYTYYIPGRSRFILGDLTVPDLLLPTVLGTFDIILIDPPLPNTSVSRGAHYGLMQPHELFHLPIPALLAPGGLLVFWLTNRPFLHKAICKGMARAWGMPPPVRWSWLKVTTRGEPVIPFHQPGRKPYETLLIVRSPGPDSPIPIPPSSIIVSVPSRHHSRKPRLEAVLDPLVATSTPRRLELFARSISPGWTCVGNECLRFQDSRYYYTPPDE